MYRHNLIRRGLAGGLVIAAASFPAAAPARVFENSGRAVSPIAAVAHTTGVPSRQAGAATQSGFQWGDAGSLIGKRYVDAAESIELLCTKAGTGTIAEATDNGIGAAGTLVLLGAGASVVGRRRRGQRLVVG